MRASIVCIALVVCLTAVAGLQAQTEKPPIPPPREFPTGDAPLEESGPITADESPKAPADNDAKAAADEARSAAEKAAAGARKIADDAAKPATEDATPKTDAAEIPVEIPTIVEAAPPATDVVAPTPGESSTEVVAEEPVAKVTVTDVEPVTEETPVTTVPTDIDTMTTTPDPTKAVEMQVAPARSVDSLLTEVELVEKIAVAREAYRLTLGALKSHYVDTHNAVKLLRVEKELAELNAVEKYHYLEEVDLAPTDLKPSKSVAAADQLYAEAMEFKNYPAFPAEKRGKLKLALTKFRTIISDYPDSDKIDDAAFRMGEIYAGWYFNDYAQAVVCFDRCTQWNPKTTFPAYYRAAKLYDDKLMLRDKAVMNYRMVLRTSTDTGHIDDARRRLQALAATTAP
jgi:TolA-binding protein